MMAPFPICKLQKNKTGTIGHNIKCKGHTINQQTTFPSLSRFSFQTEPGETIGTSPVLLMARLALLDRFSDQMCF